MDSLLIKKNDLITVKATKDTLLVSKNEYYFYIEDVVNHKPEAKKMDSLKTLRDEIAIVALQALFTSPHNLLQAGFKKAFGEEDMAKMSYCIADAMIKERNKNA